jgi:hypothetical protein
MKNKEAKFEALRNYQLITDSEVKKNKKETDNLKRTKFINTKLNSGICRIESDYNLKFDFRPFDIDFETWYLDKNCDYYFESLNAKSEKNFIVIVTYNKSNYCYIYYNYQWITRSATAYLSFKKILIDNLHTEFYDFLVEIDADCLRSYKLNLINNEQFGLMPF